MRNFPKGESFQNVAGNFINAITELIQQTGGNLLVQTHVNSTCWTVIMSYQVGQPIKSSFYMK